MTSTTAEQRRDSVRRSYARVAEQQQQGCCSPGSATTGGGCCGPASGGSSGLGYASDDLASLPAGTDLGLGCGNPLIEARLQPGDRVLDLGSGAGIDALLAARVVGDSGRVIGVDMTPQMIDKARRNAASAGAANVEFREGLIEALPVDDASIDVVISNCVVNLSPDKPQVFGDVFRVLAPGGRLAIADTVALAPLPDELRDDEGLYAGCIGGAATISELRRWLDEAGFVDIHIRDKADSHELIEGWTGDAALAALLRSATLEARKP